MVDHTIAVNAQRFSSISHIVIIHLESFFHWKLIVHAETTSA